jgi:hypothetical protein
MKKTIYTLMMGAILLFAAQANQVYAQCTTFATGPFNNFAFAPCDDGSGCTLEEITAFEAFAAESYAVPGFVAGGEYEFSLCNGPNAGTWVPDFAIVAPSGAVDAFGVNADSCTISWTASEDGTYIIVINEDGFCGDGPNTGTNNGFPALTCTGNAPCADPGSCNAGVLVGDLEVDVCDAIQTFTIEVENDTIPTGGDFAVSWFPIGAATGGTGGALTIPLPANPSTFNSDLNGGFSLNGLPPFSGTWGFIALARDANEMVCSQTTDTLFVNFGPDGESCDPALAICNAGVLASAGEVSICDANGAFDFTVTNDTIVGGGQYAIAIAPLAGASGGTGGAFSLTGVATGTDNPSGSYTADLNGALANAMFPPLAGPYSFRGLVIEADGVVCSSTQDSMVVFFGTESPSIVDITNNGADELTVNATGGVAPYAYLWDDPAAQTTQTATGLQSGIVYTVTVIDANGCLVSGESSFSVSTNSISSLNELNIAPNPSTGSFIVDLRLDESKLIEIDVLDITGKLIREAAQEASSTTFNFNLEDAPAGMYFINITVGQESMTQKVVLTK